MASAAFTSSPVAPDDAHESPRERSISLRLSVQRALLGEVFDALRAVTVREEGEKIVLTFYTLVELDDDDINSARCVGTEVAADFYPPTWVDEQFVVLPFPQRLPDDGGIHVYGKRPPLEPLDDEQETGQ